jgi:hypothetical protein
MRFIWITRHKSVDIDIDALFPSLMSQRQLASAAINTAAAVKLTHQSMETLQKIILKDWAGSGSSGSISGSGSGSGSGSSSGGSGISSSSQSNINSNGDGASVSDSSSCIGSDSGGIGYSKGNGNGKGYYVTGRLSKPIYRDDCLFDGPDPDMCVLRLLCCASVTTV